MKTFYLLGNRLVGVVSGSQPMFWGGIVVPHFGRLEWPIPTIHPMFGPYLVYRPLMGYSALSIFTGTVIQSVTVAPHEAGFQLSPTFSHTNYLSIFPEKPSVAEIVGIIFNLECSNINSYGLLSLKQLYASKHLSRVYNPPQPVFVYLSGTGSYREMGKKSIVWIGYLNSMTVRLQIENGYQVAGFKAGLVIPPQ